MALHESTEYPCGGAVKELFLTQRRKGAKKTLKRGSALRFCAFA
jgi:hypothetical protein